MVLRAAPASETVSVTSITPQDALTETTTINDYEWNRLLREYFGAFDALFPGSEKSAELESVLAKEERLLSALFATVPTYRLLVPRTRDWIETGIADDLLDCLSELNRPVETTP